MVHPSGAFTTPTRRRGLLAGIRALAQAGFEVRWDAQRMDDVWRGYYAGSDDQRAVELIDAFHEPGVDIIWCARGGSGAARIVETVLDEIDGPCRWLVGFSDNTTLISGLIHRLGWVACHGPTVSLLGSQRRALADMLHLARSDQWRLDFEAQAEGHQGPLRGPLIGGNLTVLASLVGTDLLPDLPDAIWVLEEVAEPRYRLDRTLWQLRSHLEHAAGVWLGDLGLGDGRDDLLELAQREALIADVAPVPVALGAPAAHRGEDLAVIPMGWPGTLDPQAGVWISD